MTKLSDRFDALLNVMAKVPLSVVEAATSGTPAEACPASDAETSGDCAETQIPTDISEDAES